LPSLLSSCSLSSLGPSLLSALSDLLHPLLTLSLLQILVGTYSNESFCDAMKYAVQRLGPAQAHGGFAQANTAVDDSVGLFKGPDGQVRERGGDEEKRRR